MLLKKLLLSILITFSGLCSFGQKTPYEIVVSGGTGYALSNSAFKQVVNLSLKELGTDSKVTNSILVNGMIDVAVASNISIGLAYSHFQFYWNDIYEAEISGQNALVDVNTMLQKRNYGIRGLFHFGKSEKFEVYTGLRLGFTHWKLDLDVNTDSGVASIDSLTRISDYKFPVSYPSIQAIVGFRHFIGKYIGWFGEVAVGSAPYAFGIGLNLRIPSKNN